MVDRAGIASARTGSSVSLGWRLSPSHRFERKDRLHPNRPPISGDPRAPVRLHLSPASPSIGLENLLSMMGAGYIVAILPELLDTPSTDSCRTRVSRAPVPSVPLETAYRDEKLSLSLSLSLWVCYQSIDDFFMFFFRNGMV
jgi:hypothetical protein